MHQSDGGGECDSSLEIPGILRGHGNVVQTREETANSLSEKDLFGVGDGYRTRDLLSHSQAFYH